MRLSDEGKKDVSKIKAELLKEFERVDNKTEKKLFMSYHTVVYKQMNPSKLSLIN